MNLKSWSSQARATSRAEQNYIIVSQKHATFVIPGLFASIALPLTKVCKSLIDRLF
jgi:hypothetical protein